MAYEIELQGDGISGFLLRNCEADEIATFSSSAFLSDDNSEFFYKTMAGFQSAFLDPAVNSRIVPSQIDHALVLIKGTRATVYINEINIIVKTIASRDIREGEPIQRKDMVGITELSFQGISIPDDRGIVFFFSIGWRRGFFFDFRPDGSEEHKLKNIEATLARYYETVLYNQWYSLDGNLKNMLSNLGWFPFLSIMENEHFAFLVNRLRDGSSTDKVETRLVASLGKTDLKAIEDRLRGNHLLASEMIFFEAGINYYLKEEYLASISITWTRIEGILRSNYTKKSKKGESLTEQMAKSFDGSFAYPGVFFPDYFSEYLDTYFFPDGNIFNGNADLSRHSHAHGVSDATDYDQKRALLGILMADQLGYYINASHKPTV